MIETLEATAEPPEPTGPASTSRDELFRLLTEEIKDIAEAEKLNGWTPWVILASLLSASWILIEDIWSARYSPQIVTAVFLTVTSALVLTKIARGMIEDFSGSQRTRASFFLLHSAMPIDRTLATGLWFGAAGYAASRLEPFGPIFRFAAFAYGSLFIATFLIIVIVVSRLPFPMPKSSPEIFSTIVGFVFCIALTCGPIAQVLRSGVAKGATLVDIRIGGILALGAFGIRTLASSTSPLRDSRNVLSEIRRDLVLGNSPIAESCNSARIALQGMWLSDVVRDDLRSLLELISAARAEYNEALNKVTALKNSVCLEGLDPTQASDLDKLAVRSTMEAMESHKRRAVEITEQYQRSLKSFRLQLKFFTGSIRNAKADEGRLIAAIEAAEAHVNKLQRQFIRGYADVRKARNQLFPHEARKDRPSAIET